MSTKILYSFKISFKNRAEVIIIIYDININIISIYVFIHLYTQSYTHTHTRICIKWSLENVLPTDPNLQKILKEVFKLKENSYRNLDLHWWIKSTGTGEYVDQYKVIFTFLNLLKIRLATYTKLYFIRRKLHHM